MQLCWAWTIYPEGEQLNENQKTNKFYSSVLKNLWWFLKWDFFWSMIFYAGYPSCCQAINVRRHSYGKNPVCVMVFLAHQHKAASWKLTFDLKKKSNLCYYLFVFRSCGTQDLVPRKDDHTYLASAPVTTAHEPSQPLQFRQHVGNCSTDGLFDRCDCWYTVLVIHSLLSCKLCVLLVRDIGYRKFV